MNWKHYTFKETFLTKHCWLVWLLLVYLIHLFQLDQTLLITYAGVNGWSGNCGGAEVRGNGDPGMVLI